jgi:hypothetical protein
MKILFVICRLLLGLIFFVFGLNGFLHLIPMGSMPEGLAGQFFVVMTQSHYMVPVFGLQVVCGILLLINQFVPPGFGDSRADHCEHPDFPHHDAAGRIAAGHGGADFMDCFGIATVESLRSVAHAKDDGGVSLRRE